MKNRQQKWNYDEKLSKKHLGWKKSTRSTPWSKSTVNMSKADVAMTCCWCGSKADLDLGLTWWDWRSTHGRDCSQERENAWQRANPLSGTRRRIWHLMAVIFVRLRPASRDLSNGGGGVSIGSLEQKFQRKQWVFGDCFNLWRQRVHRNSDCGIGAKPEMVKAMEERQKRQRLHEKLGD